MTPINNIINNAKLILHEISEAIKDKENSRAYFKSMQKLMKMTLSHTQQQL